MIPSRRFEPRKGKALATRAATPTMAIQVAGTQADIQAVIRDGTRVAAATLAMVRWEAVIPTQGTTDPTEYQEAAERTLQAIRKCSR
jgi:hypothetical protein